MSSDVQEIALIDKKITYNYTSYFCSNKNYIGFLIENIHESNLDMTVHDDSINESILKALIDGNKSKEISTEIRADSTLKDICIDWKLTDLYNCKGKIISYIYYIFNSLKVLKITIAAITNVRISDSGMEYSTPSRPNHTGRSNAKPTPNTISLTRLIAVDAKALPSD